MISKYQERLLPEQHPHPGAGRAERSAGHLLLRGQGVQGVQGVRGVRADRAVQGCHLGQGGLRVPGAGEGGQVSTGQEPHPLLPLSPPPHLQPRAPRFLPWVLGGRCLPWVPLGLGEKEQEKLG